MDASVLLWWDTSCFSEAVDCFFLSTHAYCSNLQPLSPFSGILHLRTIVLGHRFYPNPPSPGLHPFRVLLPDCLPACTFSINNDLPVFVLNVSLIVFNCLREENQQKSQLPTPSFRTNLEDT